MISQCKCGKFFTVSLYVGGLCLICRRKQNKNLGYTRAKRLHKHKKKKIYAYKVKVRKPKKVKPVYVVFCGFCGKEFKTHRANRLYCHDICRTALYKKNSLKRDTLSKRFKVLARDNFTCQYCGKRAGEGIELEVDHILPRALGGTNTMENLKTACFACNRGKSDRNLKALQLENY